MTAALFLIAIGVLAIAAICAVTSWVYFFGEGRSRLDVLTEADIAALLAPHDPHVDLLPLEEDE